MNKQYVSLDIEVFEQHFKVFHIEALSDDKSLYVLSAQVGNTVYTSLISSIYAGVVIREQQVLLDEINSLGNRLEREAV